MIKFSSLSPCLPCPPCLISTPQFKLVRVIGLAEEEEKLDTKKVTDIFSEEKRSLKVAETL